MRNRYFNADVKFGIDLIDFLECLCIRWQVIKFCKKKCLIKLLRKIYATNPDTFIPNTLIQMLKETYGFELKDTNPLTCEGSRKGRVYYSWRGQIHYTENPVMKFLIRLFFKQIYFY